MLRLSAILLCSVLASPAWPHDFWISRGGLRNATGEWCCGEFDCKELNYTPRAVSGGYVLDDGSFVPMHEVMPLSPEGWVICHRPDGSRRCVFAPPSGS